MKKTHCITIFLILSLSLIGSTAKAGLITSITAGESAAPNVFSLGYSYVLPNNRTVEATAGSVGFYEQVESDPANIFCSSCLDFIFQVSSDFLSTQPITRIEETGFGAFQTAVGYDSVSVGSVTLCGIDDNGFCNSGDPSSIPTTVDRSADGNIVGFNFLSGVSLSSGGTVDLVIETNALSYTDTLATVYSDTGSATASILGPPSSSIPEPATLSLLGLGLVGVGFMRSRKVS